MPGTQSGKTHLAENLVRELLATHANVILIDSKGFHPVRRIVQGQVVTDSGELESGDR